MGEVLFVIDNTPVTVGMAILAAAGIAFLAFVILAVIVTRALRASHDNFLRQALRSEEVEDRLSDIARVQAETTGRVHSMGEALSGRQAELSRSVSERLDAVTHRVGQSIEQTARHTVESLRALHERLAIIDNAHKNLTDLTAQVTTLRDVLANKQSRGAFGQARMEAIVRDGLPKGAYEFQYTLSNNKRPDCVVFLPDGRPLAIDAKFPLEAITALREARGEEEKKSAGQRVRQDVSRHVGDIAAKYLIPGETQEMALMFVPSESVYADIHDGFDDLVQKAYRARVVLVSPSLLMLAIQVMQQIMKDARMREAADRVRDEVLHMMDDLGRLRDRVLKLQTHFGQVNEDVRQVLISADKIERRAGRIEELDFSAAEPAPGDAERADLFPAISPRLQAGE